MSGSEMPNREISTITPTRVRRIMTPILFVGGITAFAVAAVSAATAPALRCQAAKEKAAGAYAQCLAGVRSKEVKTGSPRDESHCVERLEKAFAKAESKAAGACPITGDSAAAIATIDACVDGTTTAILGGVAPPGAGGAAARCDSRKTKANGTYLKCLMRARAKATNWDVFVDPTDTDKCASKLISTIDKSNALDAISPCSAIDDAPAILASANACPINLGGTPAQTNTFTMICDLGIATVQIPMALTVTPQEAFEIGVSQTVTTQLNVEIQESLVGTLLSLGATEIQLDSADSLTTVAGASGGPAVNVIEGTPFLLDLTADTNVPPNGVPGPVVIISDVASIVLTPQLAATSVDFELDSVSVELSMVPVLGTLSLACTQAPGNAPISFIVP